MTRGIAADLTDRRFGHLIAMHRNGSDDHGNAIWLCKCDCGNEVGVRSSLLRKQEFCSKQCTLYRDGMRDDISGLRFGRLTAISLTHASGKYGKTVWSFYCDCGEYVERSRTVVMMGHTASCGCYGRESRVKHGLSKTLEYHRDAHRRWAKQNPAKVIANAYKRTEALKQRVPSWLTDDHWREINVLYLTARKKTEETGIVHHVDHIFPLRGKTVNGLHVPWNLQVLTRDENLRKTNHLPDDVC